MKRASAPFLLLVLLSVLALFWPATGAPPPTNGDIHFGDTAWMLTASGLVLLMTPGLSFFYGGMVSFRNVVSTMFQSIVSLGMISLLWVLVGFSLAFGDDLGGMGLIGDPRTFFLFHNVSETTFRLGRDPATAVGYSIPLLLFAMFQLKFAVIAPALFTGSLAERVRFSAYLLFMTLFSLLIYSPLAHMTWHPDGLLFRWGVKDFAGGTVVHISAGLAALAGALILGPRKSHREKDIHTPANIPYVLLGTGLLWFGWFGFNAGSAGGANGLAALAFATTNTASASAMLGWIFLDWMLGKKPSALGGCIGAVVGLVAITPAAGFVTVPQSIFIGLTASVISNLAVGFRTRSTIDDTLDVFPCHGLGGMVGMVLTGVFAKDEGLWYGQTSLFVYHLIALAIVSVFAFVSSYALYLLVNQIIPLRVSPEEELDGLDLTQHGETAIGESLLGLFRTNGIGIVNGNGHGNGNGRANAPHGALGIESGKL